MTSLRIATWNLQWAKPGGNRFNKCLDQLREFNADVICLTEAYESTFDLLPGYTVSSDADYGYPIKEGRRKVMLWSRWPLEETDDAGSSVLPGGRFAAGKIKHDLSVDFIGVCIPWSSAHVTTGRKDRQRWEDHCLYLDGLLDIERFNQPETNTVVFGDFNHRTTGKFARKDVHRKFKQTFRDYEIITGELTDIDGKAAIDHIAVQGNVSVVDQGIISRFTTGGMELSDHFGTWCDIEPVIKQITST